MFIFRFGSEKTLCQRGKKNVARAPDRIYFWRDADGPEVDWVIEREEEYIPIEVKWSEAPRLNDAKHLQIFLSEYPNAKKAYIVSRTAKPYKLSPRIEVLSWKELWSLFE
ncbi:MAG: DUF4143 domain-containing protein [Deltaproteobacteria bacterium]|nr:DUF4143 domain-containing protein [Deltaproteobacteria bacterium]